MMGGNATSGRFSRRVLVLLDSSGVAASRRFGQVLLIVVAPSCLEVNTIRARRTAAAGRLMTIDHLAATRACAREMACSNGGPTNTTARWTPRSSKWANAARFGWCRDGHQEPGRVAPRVGVGGAGHVEQRRQPRSARQVDTIANRTGQRGHLGAKPAHDNGRDGLGSQKTIGAPAVASPHRSERGDLVGDLRPTASIARHLTTKCLLLARVRGVAPSAGPDAEQESPAAELLERGGHDRQRPCRPVRHVEHERPHHDAGNCRSDRRERRPALENPVPSVHRASQMVVEPHAPEAGLASRGGTSQHFVNANAERIE